MTRWYRLFKTTLTWIMITLVNHAPVNQRTFNRKKGPPLRYSNYPPKARTVFLKYCTSTARPKVMTLNTDLGFVLYLAHQKYAAEN